MPCKKPLRRVVLELDRRKQPHVFTSFNETFQHSVGIALPSVIVRSM